MTSIPQTAQKRKQPPGIAAKQPSGSSDIPALTVVVRIRPPNQREGELAKSDPAQLGFYSISDDSTALTLDPVTKAISWSRFDQVLDVQCDQEQVFMHTAMPILDATLNGYNATILAYGQTGSGKTYTMSGPPSAFTNPAEKAAQGVVPRALNVLFERLSSLQDTKYSVQCSYLEIYNEKCRDLLYKPGTTSASSNPSSKRVDPDDLQINVSDGVSVPGATIRTVESKLQALKVMEEGFARRQTASTKMNAQSSRSHGIFTIYITTAVTVNDVCTESTRKLHFVDLAGSESMGKTGARGDTQKEGANINTSLSTLSSVIRTLAENEQNKTNNPPPFRQSKLTKLLQDSFGCGNPLCLITNISPSKDNLTESKSSLSFASSARSLPPAVFKPKSKVTRINNHQGGEDASTTNAPFSDYQLLVNRFTSEAELAAMLEQTYQIAMLWKRQRISPI